MGGDRAVIEAVRILAGTNKFTAAWSADAEVVSVDVMARTCEVRIVSGKTANSLPGVRLMASVDDGILVVPAVGSTVVVILADQITPYVAQYSEVDTIVLRGGDLGGLVKVEDLVTRLNNLENKVNDLLTAYNSHTHPGVQSGGSSTGATTSGGGGQVTLTDRADIENEKIKQG